MTRLILIGRSHIAIEQYRREVGSSTELSHLALRSLRRGKLTNKDAIIFEQNKK